MLLLQVFAEYSACQCALAHLALPDVSAGCFKSVKCLCYNKVFRRDSGWITAVRRPLGLLESFMIFQIPHCSYLNRFICFCTTGKKRQIGLFIGDTNVTPLTANQKMRFL